MEYVTGPSRKPNPSYNRPNDRTWSMSVSLRTRIRNRDPFDRSLRTILVALAFFCLECGSPKDAIPIAQSAREHTVRAQSFAMKTRVVGAERYLRIDATAECYKAVLARPDGMVFASTENRIHIRERALPASTAGVRCTHLLGTGQIAWCVWAFPSLDFGSAHGPTAIIFEGQACHV